MKTDLTNGDMLALERMRQEVKKELKNCSKNELINLLIGALVDVSMLQQKLNSLTNPNPQTEDQK